MHSVDINPIHRLRPSTPSMFHRRRSRQALVYLPQAPFPFDTLTESRRIVTAATLDDPRVKCILDGDHRPSVALVPLSSLGSGPGRDLLRLWGGDPKNLVLIGKGRGGGRVQRGDIEAAMAPTPSEDAPAVACAIRAAVCQLEAAPPRAEQLARVS